MSTKECKGKELPSDAVFVAATPSFTEKTIPQAMLSRHMAPRGRMGRLVVEEGKIFLVCEHTGKKIAASPQECVMIGDEKFHHLELAGPVRFHVEFYDVKSGGKFDKSASRPGEAYAGKCRCQN